MGAIGAAVCAALASWWWFGRPGLRRLRAHSPTSRSPLQAWEAWRRRHLSSRRRQAEEGRLADTVSMVCDLMAVCLEAGLPPRAALRVVADSVGEPAGGALVGLCHQLDLGVGEGQVWRALGEIPGYRFVGRDVARSTATGVALAELLRAHAQQARAAALTRTRERARRVSVSGVMPLVVCYLPAFLLVAIVPIVGGLIAGQLAGP